MRMADSYKSCDSYSDSGTVRTVYFSDQGKHIDEKNFSTAFVRSGRFRFEYTERPLFPGAEPGQYIVWTNGENVQTWWNILPEIRENESLKMALAAATGVSSGTAHTVPALLMPDEITGWRLTRLRHLKKLSDADLDGVDCYRIEGQRDDPDREPVTLWISRETHLLHQIDEATSFPDFRTEQTTRYNPEVNIPIDPARLAFNAPAMGEPIE